MLDIFLLSTCRWSELIMYFGSFALWALKFKFFVGRLVANKHLPITDNCQKLKQKRYRKKHAVTKLYLSLDGFKLQGSLT